MTRLKLRHLPLLLSVMFGCADAHRARRGNFDILDGSIPVVDTGVQLPDAASHPPQLLPLDAGQARWPDAGGDSLSWLCPHDIGVCQNDNPVEPLLRTSDFAPSGAAAFFTAMGRDAVLLNWDGSQTVLLIKVNQTGEGSAAPQRWSFPSTAGRILDVVSTEQWSGGEGLPLVYALACLANCSLYEGRAGESELREVASSAVVVDQSATPHPVELILGPAGAGFESPPCIAQHGVRCFQAGGWQTIIDDRATAQRIPAASHSAGHWAFIDALGTLFKQPAGGVAELVGTFPGRVTGLGVEWRGQIQLAVDGRLGYADDGKTFRWCEQSNLGGAFISGYSGGVATIIELGGSVLHSYDRGETWCRSNGPAVVGQEFEFGSAPCGISANQRMRTLQAIYGPMACEILL